MQDDRAPIYPANLSLCFGKKPKYAVVVYDAISNTREVFAIHSNKAAAKKYASFWKTSYMFAYVVRYSAAQRRNYHQSVA
jgi:hypothetical protein